MTKLISLLTLVVILFSGTASASYPVKKEKTNISNHIQEIDTSYEKAISIFNRMFIDETTLLILLWSPFLILGLLAAHRWYIGKPWKWNLLYIITGGGCGIWAIVDLINILQGNFW